MNDAREKMFEIMKERSFRYQIVGPIYFRVFKIKRGNRKTKVFVQDRET